MHRPYMNIFCFSVNYKVVIAFQIPVLNETAFGEYKCRGINSVNSPNVLSEGVIALSEAGRF